MRVLFTSLRNTSHFQPLVPFIEECLRKGHAVAVASAPDLANHAAKSGAEFFPFGHPGDEGLRPLWDRMREGTGNAVTDIFAGACVEFAIPGLLETVERWRPSIIV